jgi:hypothetical protein
MNRSICVLLSIFALLAVVAVPASAQSIRIKSNIPFEFVYGDMTMPAGEYDLRFNDVNGTVSVQNWDQQVFASRLAVTAKPRNPQSDGKARLVFNRYGNQYFLSQIWDGQGIQGREFTQSRTEREIAKTAMARQFERVTILAQR